MIRRLSFPLGLLLGILIGYLLVKHYTAPTPNDTEPTVLKPDFTYVDNGDEPAAEIAS